MNFLPIARLEISSAARNPMTYYSRCLTALVTISGGIGFVAAGFARRISATSAGQGVFCMMAGCAYVLLAAQAILLTCDCVSREKREDTLGLLFLTPLTGFDIVAGKLAAQAGRSLSCLLAAVPAFGFCLILGGVGLEDFVVVALGLLNTLFYFSALGILMSACVRRERAAASLGGVALLILATLLPVLGMIFNCPLWMALIPAGAIMTGIAPALGLSTSHNPIVWMLISHCLGWMFIAGASYILPYAITRRPDAKWSRRTANSPPWLAELAKPLLTTAILAMICAVILGGVFLGPRWIAWPPAFLATILLMHSVLKFQAASQAGRVLADKRRTGELELLLTTPYDHDEILRASLIALKQSLFWPTIFAITMDLVMIIFVGWKMGFLEGIGCAGLLTVEIVWLLANLYGLSWVGAHLGLKLGNPVKAAGKAILYIMLIPWISGLVFVVVMSIVLRGRPFEADFIFPAWLPFIIAFAICNTLFPAHAVGELRDQFRALAART